MISESKILFITCPKGLSKALVLELLELKIKILKEETGGVLIERSLENAYKVCLWSRIANRVLWGLNSFECPSPEKLYGGVKQINWQTHLDNQTTIAVDFFTKNSEITHSQYGAQKVKDAICDQLKSTTGARPSVDLKNPDLRINVHLADNYASVSLDLSGDSLHERGYRIQAGDAPLKENLAAGILRYVEWCKNIGIQKPTGDIFFDPMCGSGTLVLEAALMALDVAPGLFRKKFGFHAWKGFEAVRWERLVKQATDRRDHSKKQFSKAKHFFGSDQDERVLKIASDNAKRAGVDAWTHFERQTLLTCKPPQLMANQTGFIALNPPYGSRLQSDEDLLPLYSLIGDTFKKKFSNWKAAVFAPYGELSKKIGLKPKRRIEMWNGPIECRLLCYELYPSVKKSSEVL